MKKVANHTPGPWSFKGDALNASVTSDAAFGVQVAWCGQNGTYGRHGSWTIGKDEAAANARLIAVAPELLAALEGMLALYDHDDGCRDIAECVAARAAIAKARGE